MGTWAGDAFYQALGSSSAELILNIRPAAFLCGCVGNNRVTPLQMEGRMALG